MVRGEKILNNRVENRSISFTKWNKLGKTEFFSINKYSWEWTNCSYPVFKRKIYNTSFNFVKPPSKTLIYDKFVYLIIYFIIYYCSIKGNRQNQFILWKILYSWQKIFYNSYPTLWKILYSWQKIFYNSYPTSIHVYKFFCGTLFRFPLHNFLVIRLLSAQCSLLLINFIASII